jgi:hypothetical protein
MAVMLTRALDVLIVDDDDADAMMIEEALLSVGLPRSCIGSSAAARRWTICIGVVVSPTLDVLI